MVKILSWNTLESGDGGAWANGWGCPLEIQRREELMKAINLDSGTESADAKSKAETILTQERFERIRKTVLEEINSKTSNNDGSDDAIDFLLFQELTVGDFWDEPSRDPSNEDSLRDEFLDTIGSLYEKVPCQADESDAQETLQHVYVRRNSGWVPSSSVTLQSNAISGGCLTEIVRCDENSETNCLEEKQPPSLILVNLHGKSRNMRDPELRRRGIFDLWEEIGSHFNDTDSNTDSNNNNGSSWKSRIILCGDWNTQLSDLIEPFRDANRNTSVLEPIVGLLDNATATTDYPFFSTNHEDGFLAQYDGCLFFGNPPVQGSPGGSPSYLELEETSWNSTGFMPKGRDGRLSGDHVGTATTMRNNFTYYRGSKNNSSDDEGVYLNGVFLPGSMPSMGLSDHLRIYTTIRINRNSEPSRNDSNVVDEQWILSAAPSGGPSSRPSRRPSGGPSAVPSGAPSGGPSAQRSGAPSGRPNAVPSEWSSTVPSDAPSGPPSMIVPRESGGGSGGTPSSLGGCCLLLMLYTTLRLGMD